MEELEHTILNFYAGDAGADEWLTRFQESDEAWVASIHLLESESQDVQAFAANVLLQKCRREAAELPGTSRDELTAALLARAEVMPTDSIRRVLFASAAAATAPLCVEPADFEAHFSLPYIQGIGTASQCLYLAALGEEFAGRADRIDPEHMDILCSAVATILAHGAEKILTDGSGEVHQFLASVEAWGSAGLNLGHLLDSSLLEAILGWCADPELTLSAAKSLTECAEQPLADSHLEHLAQELVPSLASLTPLYHSAIEAEEEEWCGVFALMVCATGKRTIDVVASCRETPLQDAVGAVLEVLVLATGHSSLPISEEMLGFWDALAAKVPPDDFWGDFFGKVVHTVLDRCQFEPDFDTWDTAVQDEDTFRRFRRSAQTALLAAASVLQGDTLSVITQPLSDAGAAVPWQSVEVAFFGAAVVASEVAAEGSRFQARASAAPPLCPETNAALVSFVALGFGETAAELHPIVRCAALKFVKAYCGWLSRDSERLERVVEVTIGCMEDETTLEAGAEAFESICAVHGKLIAASMDLNALIEQTARSTFPTPMARTTARALIRVIACCPVGVAQEHVRTLVHPILESLAQLYSQHASSEAGEGDVTAEIAKELHVLGVVIRFLDTLAPAVDESHMAVQIFGLFWETFEALKTAFVGSDAVLLELCGVIDSVIHSAKVHSLEVLPTVFPTLLSIMEQVIPEPHMIAPFTTSLEYHGQLAPREAQTSEEVRAEVLQYFGTALDLAFERLNLRAPDFSRNSPAYGAYLDFGRQMIIFSPESVATSEALPHVLDFCVMCIESGSREALRAACPLLSRAVQSNHYELFLRVQAWLELQAARTIELLMQVICFHGSLDVIMKPAEVMYEVGEAVGFEHLPGMLVDAMQAEDFAKIDEAKRIVCIRELGEASQHSKVQFIKTLLAFGKSCRL